MLRLVHEFPLKAVHITFSIFIHSNTKIPNNFREELFGVFASNMKQRVSAEIFEEELITLLTILENSPEYQERFEKVGISELVLERVVEFYSRDEEGSKKMISNYSLLTDMYKWLLRGRENRITQSILELQIQEKLIHQIFSRDYRKAVNLQLLSFLFVEETKITKQPLILKTMLKAIEDKFWDDIESIQLICKILLDNLKNNDTNAVIILQQFDFIMILFNMIERACSLHDTDKSDELLATRAKCLINLIISLADTSKTAKVLFTKQMYAWNRVFRSSFKIYGQLSGLIQESWLDFTKSLFLMENKKQIRNREALKYYIRNFMGGGQLKFEEEVAELAKLSPENLSIIAELEVLQNIFRSHSNEVEKLFQKEWILEFSFNYLTELPNIESLEYISTAVKLLTKTLNTKPEHSEKSRQLLSKILTRFKELISFELPSLCLNDSTKGIYIPNIISTKDSSSQKTNSQFTCMVWYYLTTSGLANSELTVLDFKLDDFSLHLRLKQGKIAFIFDSTTYELKNMNEYLSRNLQLGDVAGSWVLITLTIDFNLSNKDNIEFIFFLNGYLFDKIKLDQNPLKIFIKDKMSKKCSVYSGINLTDPTYHQNGKVSLGPLYVFSRCLTIFEINLLFLTTQSNSHNTQFFFKKHELNWHHARIENLSLFGFDLSSDRIMPSHEEFDRDERLIIDADHLHLLNSMLVCIVPESYVALDFDEVKRMEFATQYSKMIAFVNKMNREFNAQGFLVPGMNFPFDDAVQQKRFLNPPTLITLIENSNFVQRLLESLRLTNDKEIFVMLLNIFADLYQLSSKVRKIVHDIQGISQLCDILTKGKGNASSQILDIFQRLFVREIKPLRPDLIQGVKATIVYSKTVFKTMIYGLDLFSTKNLETKKKVLSFFMDQLLASTNFYAE